MENVASILLTMGLLSLAELSRLKQIDRARVKTTFFRKQAGCWKYEGASSRSRATCQHRFTNAAVLVFSVPLDALVILQHSAATAGLSAG